MFLLQLQRGFKQIFLLLVLLLISVFASAQIPTLLREYLFNETGDKTYSTHNGAYLELTKNKGETPFDLHSEPGAGVSGTLEDRAFDNSLAEKMGGNSYGFAVEPNNDNELKELKSFTVQTWVYAHQDGVITGQGNAARLVYNGTCFDIYFETLGITCKINGQSYRSLQNIYYGSKWVFIAITFDDINQKVKFYVGDKENQVTFVNEVSTTTSPGKDTLKLSIGDMYIGGDRAFKGLIDNFRIYGSKIDASGALDLYQLESLRIKDMIPEPDETNCTIVLNQDKCPADGDQSIDVTVTVRDKYGSKLEGQTVSLYEVAGTLPFTEQTTVTDQNGEAVFALQSIVAGTATLEASVDPGFGLPVVVLENAQQNIEFVQAISPSYSSIKCTSDGDVSADGVSQHLIKVTLLDFNQDAVSGHVIALASTSEISIVSAQKASDENGEALFQCVSKSSSFTSIQGQITASVQTDAQTINLTPLDITFSGKVKMQADGEPYSKLSISRELAPGLNEKDIADDVVPTDGVSRWNFVVQLINDDGVMANRRVTIAEIGGNLLDPTAFQPEFALTDEEGNMCFSISTGESIESTIMIRIQVADDVGKWEIPIKLVDIKDSIYVVETYPASNVEDAELQAPFTITYSKPVKLVPGDSKLTFTPCGDGSGRAQVIEDIYGIEDQSWLCDGETITWINHPRLELNITYTAKIEGIADSDTVQARLVKDYSWDFKGTDSILPYVVNVIPEPWAVDVSRDTQVEIVLSEDLYIDPVSQEPLGLAVQVMSENGSIFTGPISYTASSGSLPAKLSFVLSDLAEDITYTVRISGARDLAYNVMPTYSWCFTTTTGDSPLRIIKIELEKNEFAVPTITTPLKIYFNKEIKLDSETEISVWERDDTGSVIEGTYSLGQTEIIFSLLPGGTYTFDTWYELNISGIKGKADGSQLSDYSYTFCTEVLAVSESFSGEVDNELKFPIGPVVGDSRREVKVLIPSGVMDGGELIVLNVSADQKTELNKYIWSEYLCLSPYIYEFKLKNWEKYLFEKKVTITIPYLDDGEGNVLMLNGDKVPASSLKIFYWDPVRGEWIPVGGRVDFGAQTVSFEVDHFSIYGLLGTSSITNQILSEVALTVNPLAFIADHRQETTFKFRLANPGKVTLVIYDSKGRVVTTLLKDALYPEGYNGFTWDGSINGVRIRPGIYLYRLFATSMEGSNTGDVWVSGTLGVIR